MDLSPKPECGLIPDAASRLPATVEEAVTYFNSKFKFHADSVRAYEEWEAEEGLARAVHVTYALEARLLGSNTVKDLINAWLFSMMDAALNSKRERLYWRLFPEIKVIDKEFPDGLGFVVQIRSRSSMF